MSGNLCRCAAYPNILQAIREVTGKEADSAAFEVIGGTDAGDAPERAR